MRVTTLLLLVATVLSVLGPIPARLAGGTRAPRCCCASLHGRCTCTGACCDHGAPRPATDPAHACFDSACAPGPQAPAVGANEPAVTPTRVACDAPAAPRPARPSPAERRHPADAPRPSEPPPEAARG